MNLPIYRAKKIDSDKYIQGYLLGMWGEYFISWGETNHVPNKVQIDPLTLAVHFKGMIDSQGNKIFASLSNDGKGGDIVQSSETSVGLTAVYKNGNFNFVSFPLDDYKNATHAETYSSYISNTRFDHKGKINYHRKTKVIGIQE